ncbi:addiction module antitoxin RelB [Actinomycetota bacterium]|nr:addiction module antitoxin RelB [Actinomycetota bacterium]
MVIDESEFEVIKSDEFNKWLEGLKDRQARYRITQHIDRLRIGLLGDFEIITKDIMELRFHFGPGYRVYIHKEGSEIIVLLNGGDKSTQSKDIKKAKKILQEFEEEYNG